MKIKELMTRGVASLNPRASLTRAAQLMSEANVGSIPIVEGGRLVGVLTDRDIVVRTIAAGINPGESTVGEVMTPSVVRCREEDDVEEAAELMTEHRIHRLVVTDAQGRLAGIVALADLAPAAFSGKREGEAPVASLLEGELCAVRTYQAALKAFGPSRTSGELRRIERDHVEAARVLREALTEPGRPAWGAQALWRGFTEAVGKAAAKRPGEGAMLMALKSGEELEIRDYHQALDDARVPPVLKDAICDVFLPRAWAHRSTLERCMQSESSA